MRRALLLVLVACAAAAPARADWTAPVIVSANSFAQGDNNTDQVDVSGDGRYLAFLTGANNLYPSPAPPGFGRQGGVFRKDMLTGDLQLAVPQRAFDLKRNLFLGQILSGSGISVSADGRWVVFTTTQRLDPVDDTNTANDVYERDMDKASTDPGAYRLVSALDGQATGLTYDGNGGSTVFAHAVSADGSKVAFATLSSSNLLGTRSPTTSRGQVVLRDLGAQRTTVVSTQRNRATGAMTSTPIDGFTTSPPLDVTLSADGSTVVWRTFVADQQLHFLPGDNSILVPVWRRVADGPQAPIRQIAGAGDPEDPGCPANGAVDRKNLDNPCNGALRWFGGLDGVTGPLSVSADGRLVAYAGTAPREAATTWPSDLYVTDMGTTGSRKAATTRSTHTSGSNDPAGPFIGNPAISGDGRWITFTTARKRFTLVPPTPIGDFPESSQSIDVYVIDRERQTLEQLSHGTDGGPTVAGSGDSASAAVSSGAAIAGDGSRVAFISNATNLFFGDGNDRRDAFALANLTRVTVPSDTSLPGDEDSVAYTPAQRVRVTTASLPDGTVRVDVVVPEAGRVDVGALALLPSGKRRKRQAATRTEALNPSGTGLVTTTLKLLSRARAEMRRAGALDTTVRVAFVPRAGGSGRALERAVPARFETPPAFGRTP